MKLFVIAFVLAMLLFSVTPIVSSSYALSSPGHTSLPATLAPNPLVIRNRTLTSPNVQDEAWFGWSVSMSGGLVAVGSPDETVEGYFEAGQAYVFNATSGRLIETLTSPNVQDTGGFGYSVSMSGKLVAVGAYYETADGYAGAGHAYVFNSATGKLITSFTSPNAQEYGEFGWSVSISNKLLTVGAPDENASGYSQAGHAYVFNAISGALIQTLTSPNAQTGGNFGWSLSMTSKLVAVGAVLETAKGYSEAGHAYIFNSASGKVIASLTSPKAQSEGYFGWSVSLTGKLVAVGAPLETADGYAWAGHAYVFNSATGKLVRTLASPNAQAYGEFGLSVSMTGKLVAVGAAGETANGYSYAGHAYVYNLATGRLVSILTSPNAQALGDFGLSVSMTGKVVTVGAPTETVQGDGEAGHAYMFYGV